MPSFDWLQADSPLLTYNAVLGCTNPAAPQPTSIVPGAAAQAEAALRRQSSEVVLLMEGVSRLAWEGSRLVGRWQGAPVAIKIALSPAARLHHETTLGAWLDHPHVLQTYASRIAQLDDSFFCPPPPPPAPAGVAAGGNGASRAQTGTAHVGSPAAAGGPRAGLPREMGSSLADVLLALGARPGQHLSMLVSEHGDCGNLQSLLGGGFFRSSSGVRMLHSLLRCAREVGEGLAYVHSRGLVHGSVSPTTVVLKSMHSDVLRGFVCKLSSVSLPQRESSSVNVADSSSSSNSGSAGGAAPASPTSCSAHFMAPEHLRGRAASTASDVWSLGVIMWALVHDAMPYQGCAAAEVGAEVASGRLRPVWQAVCPTAATAVALRALQSLVEACIAPEPRARPTALEVVARLFDIKKQMPYRDYIARGSARAAGGGGGAAGGDAVVLLATRASCSAAGAALAAAATAAASAACPPAPVVAMRSSKSSSKGTATAPSVPSIPSAASGLLRTRSLKASLKALVGLGSSRGDRRDGRDGEEHGSGDDDDSGPGVCADLLSSLVSFKDSGGAERKEGAGWDCAGAAGDGRGTAGGGDGRGGGRSPSFSSAGDGSSSSNAAYEFGRANSDGGGTFLGSF